MVEDKTTDGDGIDPETQDANRPTADFRSDIWPNSHIEESRRYREEHVPGAGGVDILVELERLRKEVYPDLYRRLFGEAGSDENVVLVLNALLGQEGRTYDDLVDAGLPSRRTAKRRVYDLRDLNVVEVEGRPARVYYSNDEVRLLASDVLSFLS
jgi:hypothetical protein